MSNKSANEEGIGVERVGETIHRERLTRNILIETVAEDLKLSSEFIRGIEESDYSDLPSMPYIRVYIKSIAEYLNLNSDELLERFSEEQNLVVPDPAEERRDTISVKVQGEKKNNPFIPILFIAAAVIVIILILRKPEHSEETPAPEQVDSVGVEAPQDTAEPSDEQLPKGMTVVDTTVADSIPELAVTDSVKDEALAVEDTAVSVAQKMRFTVSGRSDSSWLRVFVDGVSEYDGFIRYRNNLDFTAADSINFVIGSNSSVRYRLNDDPFHVSGAGLKVVKIAPDTVEVWRMKKWRSVFKGRL